MSAIIDTQGAQVPQHLLNLQNIINPSQSQPDLLPTNPPINTQPSRMGPPPLCTKTLRERGYLNCEIPSGLDSLDELESFGFLPGRFNCRPTPEVLAVKQQYLDEVIQYYDSVGDRVLEEIFECPVFVNPDENRLTARMQMDDNRRKFQVHKFPYSLPKDVLHYVMWYTQEGTTLTASDITKHIEEDIKDICGDAYSYEFGWYENPKMTVLEVYHVQVFWRKVRTSMELEPKPNNNGVKVANKPPDGYWGC